MAEWILESTDGLTFTVEITLAVGFIIICVLLFLLRSRFPQLTLNGWIELVVGSFCLALKGISDGLDTISPTYHDIFDIMDASFMILGLILLGIGLLRITFYSAKVWEVR